MKKKHSCSKNREEVEVLGAEEEAFPLLVLVLRSRTRSSENSSPREDKGREDSTQSVATVVDIDQHRQSTPVQDPD